VATLQDDLQGILEKHKIDPSPAIGDLVAFVTEKIKHTEEQAKAVTADTSTAQTVLASFAKQSQSARDPVEVMREILKDDAYTKDEKVLLFMMSRERFRNRRRMAYISLGAIVVAAILLVLAIMVEAFGWADPLSVTTMQNGMETTEDRYVSDIIQKYDTTIMWLGGFFTSIIAFYFGASALRPSS